MFALRHSLTKDHQEYDSTGKLLTPGDEGSWTLYSMLLIHNIIPATDKLEVQAIRVGIRFNGQQLVDVEKEKDPKHAPRPVGDHVTMRLAFSAPLDAEALHQLWGQVFALTATDFVASVSPLWQTYVEEHLDTQAIAKGNIQFNAEARRAAKKEPENVPEMSRAGKSGIKAPKPISTTEPEFGNGLERLKMNGSLILSTKINEKGIPEAIHVLRPLGLGIDELAAKGVSRWRFQPAMRDGVPVVVRLDIEVSYKGG